MKNPRRAYAMAKKYVDNIQKGNESRLRNVEQTTNQLANMNINNDALVTESTMDAISYLPKNASERPLKTVFRGRTLVNLLGEDGNFEKDSNGDGIADGWRSGGTVTIVQDSSVYKYGNYSTKMTIGDAGRQYFDVNNIDPDKYYIILVESYISSYSGGDVSFLISDYDSNLNYEIHNFDSSKLETWQLKHAKFSGRDGIRITLGRYMNTTDHTVNFDGLRLYEIPQSTYDAIDNMTDDEVARMFPYVDSVQHVKNPSVVSTGKNLLPPYFSDFSSNPVVENSEPYKLSFSWDGGFDIKEKRYLIGGENYTFKIKTEDESNILGFVVRDKDGNNVISPQDINGELEYSFVISNSGSYDIVIIRSDLTGSATVIDWQLNIGQTALSFEPYTESKQHIDIELAGNDDVQDEVRYNQSTQQWEYVKRWEKDVVLDGRQSYSYFDSGDGLRRVVITGIDNIFTNSNRIMITKYNGKPLLSTSSTDTIKEVPDSATIGSVNILLSISDTDSGWNTTPSQNMVKAYFNGWKYTGDGSAHSWESIVDGSSPLEQSSSYLAGHVAEYWTPYRLTYQLAEPIIEPITEVFGTPMAHPNGQLTYSNVLGRVGYYEANGITEDITFSDIVKVNKVDKETGEETDVTDSCTLNDERTGFTSTELSNGDLVWYELRVDNTAIGEMEYSYYDSRFVVEDSVTGVMYDWKVVVADGVPSIELVEI